MREDKGQGALITVRMVRNDLDGVPEVPPPPPFALRGYRPGDAATWVAVHRDAERYHDVDEALFRREFGWDEAALAARQLFLCDERGEAVATATAWSGEHRGRPHGRIHWVAVVPRLQGRGLGKALVSALCRRFRELGHERAYLTTETVRLPAIRLYLAFGFRPDIADDGERRIWEKLQGQLGNVPTAGGRP